MAVNDGDGVRLDIDRLVSSIEDIVPEDPLNRLVSSSIEDMVPEDPLNRLVSSIEDMVPEDPLMPPTCCIFKIPVILFRHNNKAFIPDAFSIGPLHHEKRKLKATEKIKAKYLQALISRSHSPNTMLRTMVSAIMEVEKKARECYAEAIPYNPEQLVQILVIDGCFLIEFFLKFANRKLKLKEKDDPIFSRSCMLQFLNHDLILLENQVPWMVLEILFDLTKVSSDKPLILLASNFLAKNHFQEVLGAKLSKPDVRSAIMKIEGIKHFVDLSKKLSTLSTTEVKEESKGKYELLPSATSLVEAGIKFKKGTSLSILDIIFKDGVLEIPPFQIQETTETVFRNLISYEQCHPNPMCEDRICEDRITSYATFLDNLINTAKDIDILCENKIIDNWLNPEDAAQLFNKLYHDTYVNYCYKDVNRQVNSFCERSWPRWRAVLMRNYFNTPWAFISTLGAVILLLLTLLQTVYSMKK